MVREAREQIATETEIEADLDLDRPSGPSSDVTRLYRLWEANPWSAYAIDFSQDITDWRDRMTAEQRAAARWHYAQFLHGEEAVARTLAPFVAAVPTQEQRVFITTQIVDEARHHVFFSRFVREVMGEGENMAGALAAVRPDLTAAFRQVFAELDRLTDRLRRHPDNRALLAQSITLYHLIVEGMLAAPNQRVIHSYLTTMVVLPGLAEGIAHVSRDETRHVAFGVQMLAELVAGRPEAKTAVICTLNRVLPWTTSMAYSPELGEEPFRALGWDMLDVFTAGLRSLETKLGRVGIPLAEVAAIVRLGADRSPREQAQHALALLRAGIYGEVAPLRMDDETLALVFQSLEWVVNMRPASRLPGAIQWDFTDAPPWYLAVEGERAVARQGSAASPVVTLRCRVEDWGRIAGEKLHPMWALATGRLKLSGDRRALLQLGSLLNGA